MAEYRSPGDNGVAIAKVWLSIDRGQDRSLCKGL